jgi:hypothetical protein
MQDQHNRATICWKGPIDNACSPNRHSLLLSGSLRLLTFRCDHVPTGQAVAFWQSKKPGYMSDASSGSNVHDAVSTVLCSHLRMHMASTSHPALPHSRVNSSIILRHLSLIEQCAKTFPSHKITSRFR